MSKERIVYKVVGLDLRSRLIKSDDISVQYQVGKWVKPKHRDCPLFAFDTLSGALRYNRYDNGIIFKARACMSKRCINLPHIPSTDSATLVEALAMWRGERTQRDWCLVPPGTVFCTQVKLLEKIDDNSTY